MVPMRGNDNRVDSGWMTNHINDELGDSQDMILNHLDMTIVE